MLEIPKMSYFNGGNTWCASNGDVRLRIAPAKDKLEVFIWHGIWCFEKTPKEQMQIDSFDFSPQGLSNISQHVNSKFV